MGDVRTNDKPIVARALPDTPDQNSFGFGGDRNHTRGLEVENLM